MNIVKPKTLYHGSRHKGLEHIQPQARSYPDLYEGGLVFATESLPLAVIFMVNTPRMACGRFDDMPYAVLPTTREAFIASDTGGHVYILPSDTFEPGSPQGMEGEWVSKVPVKPIEVIEYPSVLDAMIEQGVQVYFVDTPTIREIERANDHGRMILRFLQSENQWRETNGHSSKSS